ncbi:MAG: ATP synthase F1 subunit epsilon [Acidobacteriaceae bacterium]|nr:ATP synthase F1 subunit epsilon [Acidobacteriaceae bacterium]
MPDTFQLEVATPERLFIDEQVLQAELPGRNGQLGILAGHAPLLSALGPGVLSYTRYDRQQFLAIDGGFVEVFENHVRVLADHAEFSYDIDVAAARRELDEAHDALRSAQDAPASEAANHAIAKAQARLDAAARSSGETASS